MNHEVLASLYPYFVNFSVLVVSVFLLARKPFAKFVYQRHERIKDLILEANRKIEESNAKAAEVRSKLEGLDSEEKHIISQAILQAKQEGEELEQKARLEAVRLAQESEKISVNERADRIAALREGFLTSAIQQAELTLKSKLKTEDHSQIIKDAQNQLEVGA